MKNFPHAIWDVNTETKLDGNKLVTSRYVKIIIKGLPEGHKFNNFVIKIDDDAERFIEEEYKDQPLEDLISDIRWQEGRLFGDCFVWSTKGRLQDLEYDISQYKEGKVRFLEWLKAEKEIQLQEIQAKLIEINEDLEYLREESGT